MATPVIMPRQGQSVESCIIGKWHKKTGDAVKSGDILFTYETDKATFDETAKSDGVMLALFFEEGDDVPCLTNVCVIGEAGEDFSAFAPTDGDVATTPTPTNNEMAPATAAPATITEEVLLVSPTADGAAISPRAKNLAERTGADLRFAQASGPMNRIIERDVEALVNAGKLATLAAGLSFNPEAVGTGIGGRVSISDTAAATGAAPLSPTTSATAVESYTEKHSNIRKVIAKSMHASLSQMAQLTLNSSFDATDILALRSRLKKAKEAGLTSEQGFSLVDKIPTINDIILYAASRVLLKHRECNAHYDDEKMTYFNHVHMGVAIDTPRGLMVPTVFNCDQLGLAGISKSVKEVADACQSGTINPDLLRGGTFTVTNLGTMGIESFTPVINPPQTCILGVNTITTKVKTISGELKGYSSIGLSLTFDHRALDGAPAARFLKDLVHVLENFSLFMLQ